MGFHMNSKIKPILNWSSVVMGDLAEGLTNLLNTYLSIINVTKGYGLIQTTHMVKLWLLILPIILALKVA